MGEHDYSAAIAKTKVPMLILDQKWHRLFALGGKPSNVKELETRENDLLKREAELKKELKDLKKVKENLMSSVMSNMEGTSDLVSKKLDDDKRLLEECKERIASAEDELMDIPNQTEEVNKQLMLASMDYCYDKLRTNSQEAEEITNWIKDIRVQLKKNVIRKHNREINNKEIYSYMHDVFGMEVLNLFDLQNGDFYLGTADDKADDKSAKKSSEEEAADLSNVNLEDVDLDAVSKETKEDSDEIDESIESAEENQ
ncbi:hypothetical protein SAMN04487829_0767 [Pseudobutyrivibrio sp. NOR37]|uniref:Uncharacterized protein n=1 Tax=Pseudobutyrivibrio xylanivorans TaxID=185007 RepID=A0A6M0LF40_PSEXY|nr:MULTISPECIES: hypothetical protein [Pseudobutyrivibrio]NEX01184.1 hypothetical protein [Pseudobutyrivibrio xylanivorans]SFR65616.1 hypothetical protein SAMN04487829_0767 [Pseudobutyrivibrio sp. NOR37]